MMKTPFTDAVETTLPKVGGDNVPMPASSGSPLTTCFGDALETKVPNTRTGGALPEVNVDKSVHAPVPVPPETGKTFKIG